MGTELILIMLFGVFLLLIFLGQPFAWAMGASGALLFFLLGGTAKLYSAVLATWGQLNGFTWLAIPLFILMGSVLRLSGIADDLFEMVYRWIGHLRGGLAVGAIAVATVFAALCGVSSAATPAVGLIALPPMFKRNYNKDIALGSIMGGGILALLIPPSISPIILGQYAEISIGKLLIGGILPGLLMATLFALYILARCSIQPHLAPVPPAAERYTWRQRLASTRAVILPIFVMGTVLGSIYAGICTPSEAAAVGAGGAFICALIRRKLNWSMVREALLSSLRLATMIMWIVAGGTLFANVIGISGSGELIRGVVTELGLGYWGSLVFLQFIVFIMGMFMETACITIILIPIFMPLVHAFGMNPVWFGVIYIMTNIIGFLTPPVGINLFLVRAIVPEGVSMGDIYRAAMPFMLLMVLSTVLVMVFPQIATLLPGMMK